MRGEIDGIRAAGAELVVVGSGRPWHARAFRDQHGLDFPLRVDPDLVAYRAAGLRRGAWRTLGPRVLARAARAFRKGFRQGEVQGDPWQQGGVFLVRAGGRVAWQHVSEEAGDHPSTEAIREALKRL